jgi:cation-transporting ATPase E
VIGNIERVSNLFLTKTVYSVLLALMVGFARVNYPFLPRHVTVIAWFTIGIPAFVLSLAPNNERARSGFVKRVLRLALPSGAVIAIVTFVSYMVVHTKATPEQAGTTALITLIIVALWVLGIVARPYRWWKLLLIGVMALGSVLLFVLPFAQRFFALDPSDSGYTWSGVLWAAVGVVVVEAIWWIQRAVTSRGAAVTGGA